MKFSNILINLTVSLVSLVLFLGGAEFYFYKIYTPSSGYAFDLSAVRWFEKHWKPINSLGYRDAQRQLSSDKQKKVVFMVGDSVTAGQGVDDYEQRFSNILNKQLGNDWLVLNVAKNGWNTEEHVSAIKSDPITPDIVVLVYFVNDINDACRHAGLGFKREPIVIPEGPFKGLIANSHLVNYFYWRVYRFNNRYYGESYWDKLKKCFVDEKSWAYHTNELDQLRENVARRGAELKAVIVPHLLDVAGSRELTKKIDQYFKSHQIESVDLSDFFLERDPKTLVVNDLDAHPNKEVHKEMADVIYKKFFTGSAL